MGVWIIVQSQVASSSKILEHLKNHMVTMQEKVKNLSEEDFKTAVDAVMIEISEKNKN